MIELETFLNSVFFFSGIRWTVLELAVRGGWTVYVPDFCLRSSIRSIDVILSKRLSYFNYNNNDNFPESFLSEVCAKITSNF